MSDPNVYRTYNSCIQAPKLKCQEIRVLDIISPEFDDLEERVTLVEDDMTTAKAEIIALQVLTNLHTADISSLQSRMTTAESDITTIESDITTIEADITNIKAVNITQSANITTLQNKTVHQTADATYTIFQNQMSLPNAGTSIWLGGTNGSLEHLRMHQSGTSAYVDFSGDAKLHLRAMRFVEGAQYSSDYTIIPAGNTTSNIISGSASGPFTYNQSFGTSQGKYEVYVWTNTNLFLYGINVALYNGTTPIWGTPMGNTNSGSTVASLFVISGGTYHITFSIAGIGTNIYYKIITHTF